MPRITYDNVHEALLAAVPEMRGPYEGLVHGSTWRGEKPGQYIIFEDLLNPLLARLLEREEDQDALERIFGLFEQMAKCEDGMVCDLLGVAEIEWLFSYPELMAKAWKYMGGKTKAMAREMAKASEGHWKTPSEAAGDASRGRG